MKKPLEKQLAETQQRLEEVEAEYKAFAYISSHDLSGPLRAIEAFASMLAKDGVGSLDDKNTLLLNQIMNSVEKGKVIVAALLSFSRLNTQAEPFTAIDSNTVVREVQAELSDLIEATTARITIANLPAMQGDKKHITQVFYQLLKNALTYQTEGNQPHINITVEEKDNRWQFSIVDNGIGIKPQLFEEIFSPLRRAVRNKDYPGIGMGLTIAKKILQHHQGGIWVESEENTGSTFHFTVSKELEND